jgi:hypothetical protein
MSTILTINRSGLGSFRKNIQGSKNKTSSGSRVLNFKKTSREASFGRLEVSEPKKIFKSATFILVSSLIFSGALYLYQVNDLTNKGYEMKETERQIAQLKEINEKNKIKEIELRSMYNIEKTTQDLELVNSENVSYLELDGPMAMK